MNIMTKQTKPNKDQIILGIFVAPLLSCSYFFKSMAFWSADVSRWFEDKTDYFGIWIIKKFNLTKVYDKI